MNKNFDEKLARQLIDQYDLSENTLRVWKNRGKIPDKYFKAGFKIVKNVKENSETRKLRKIITCREIATNNFRTGDIHPNYKKGSQRLQDIRHGMPFIEEEILGFKDEIVEIRNLARKVIDTRSMSSMKEFISDERIKHTIILGREKLYYAIYSDSFLDEDMKDLIVMLVSTFYNQIRI